MQGQMMVRFLLLVIGAITTLSASYTVPPALASADQTPRQIPRQAEDKFRSLEPDLPTANSYRTASGAPGHEYWQQRADYRIDVTLDESARHISATQTVTYTNNSPDELRYLWLALDQNRHQPGSDNLLGRAVEEPDQLSFPDLRQELESRTFEGGHEITAVRDADGRDLPHTIVSTHMRIDLHEPLKAGETMTFTVEWGFDIPSQKTLGGRAGYEHFSGDGNDIFLIAKWFPRMAAYTDSTGWQNKAFLGAGEFTLEFGNYDVAITVPSDHVVSATGVLENPDEVLTRDQRARLDRARSADKPVYIVTPDEARKAESRRARGTRTWRFRAENVRDFAFASSRKFMWDALGHEQEDGSVVMAMSFFPTEANPLWETYSTRAIVHALDVFSRHTFPYPYPVAQSVNGPVYGMEYPMISFNGPRPDRTSDGEARYGQSTKYGLISVIIHEIGHNYFPMIINSDERQWAWMDEGLVTFFQFLAEQEWEEDYPSFRGEPRNITDYMTSTGQVPIMTRADSVRELGSNAYGKTAAGLTILRETILGRDLFDHAFREYARRWKFKRPAPADFFRTMSDASGVDLDWFWRDWFYTTNHVDISLDRVRRLRINTEDPRVENRWRANRDKAAPPSRTVQRNEGMERLVERHPELEDFYNRQDQYTVTNKQLNEYATLLETAGADARELLNRDDNIYILDFTNRGGVVMPIILDIEYDNGDREELHLPAQIWRKNPATVSKLLIRERSIRSVTVDPHWETADSDVDNNVYPRRIIEDRIDLYHRPPARNMMEEMDVPLSDDAKNLPRPRKIR